MKIYKTEHWAIKGNELLIHKTTWINLKSMLSEGRQTQRRTYCMISFQIFEQAKLRYNERNRISVSMCIMRVDAFLVLCPGHLSHLTLALALILI